MRTTEFGVVEGAAREAASLTSLLNVSTSLRAASYLGRDAQSPVEARTAIHLMLESLQDADPLCSSCITELRLLISRLTDENAVETCRYAADGLAETGTELTRVATTLRSKPRPWWKAWS